MRTVVKTLIVIVISLLFFSPVFAQNYYFQQFSLEEGLPQSQVTCIHQDSRGVIWIGTNGGGLCRFNGLHFKVFSRREGLSSDQVNDIFEDSGGNLWIGTYNGLSCYDGIRFKNIYFDSLNAHGYGQFNEDKKGNIYFVGYYNSDLSKIYRFDGKNFQVLNDEFKDLKSGIKVFGILRTSDDRLLINTPEHIYEYRDGILKLSEYEKLPEFRGKTLRVVFQDKRNILFLVAREKNSVAVYTYRDNQVNLIQWPSEINPNRLNTIYNDSKGNYWLADSQEGKLFQVYGDINNGNYKVFSKANGLPGEIIRNITEDNEGNLWFGTDGAGLFKYGGSKFIAFTKQHGLGDNIIWSIYQDPRGIYWFGTAVNGISRFDGENFENYQNFPDNPIGVVRAITDDNNRKLLVGTDNGLWSFENGKFRNVSHDFGLSETNTAVTDLLPEPKGIWIATIGYGLFHYSGGTVTSYSLNNKNLDNNQVNHLLVDHEGNLWVATNGGIAIIKKDNILKCSIREGLSNRMVMQLTEDHAGNIWAATYGGGICRITFSKSGSIHVRSADSNDGLSSDNVYSILTDRQGNLWAGCQNGVDKIILDSQGNIISIRNYDRFEGFTGIENNSASNLVDKDGKLWFGTIKGVMLYNPQVDVINTRPPVTSVTKIKLFYKDINWIDEDYKKYCAGIMPWNNLPANLSLAYNKNHISLEFEGLSYKVPEKVRYQWKLEGIDKDWSPVSSESEAVYSNLNPGDYTFYVKASNNDGIWNSTPAAYRFVIRSPFWQTWWFRAVFFIFLVTLTVIVFWLRQKMIGEKQEELEQLVFFKTKKLEDQKNEILIQRDKLKQSYENLELLSEIGKEITANLTVEAIVESVYGRLNALMDASVIGIGISDEENSRLFFPILINNGRRMESVEISFDHTSDFAISSLLGNREIIINNYYEEYKDHLDEWTVPDKNRDPLSIVYIPLAHDTHPLGILTVQSYTGNAFQEYQLNIIRNLSIYARIALENASTYEKIQEQKNNLSRANEDITRQKEEIEKKNFELEELNNEKSHIISIVAHDLRNPLTSALTMTGLMKTEIDPVEEDQAIYANAIEKSLNRMNEMITRLLDIRKLEERAFDLRLERLNLEKIIREVNKNLQTEFERKRIRLELESEELYANLDKDFTTQIFENLLSNAVKFSPPDTRVCVKISKENGKARAQVKDQGPGLTEEDMKNLFGKFQRLSAKPTGGEHSTGLGLSIVKKYVEAMNGKVWCESEPGKGANFIVEFIRA